MKKSEVKVGHVYVAKVSDRLVPVRIDSVHSRQGWNATNTKTGRRVHIKSAQRLRYPAKSAAKAEGREVAAAAKTEERNDRDKDRAPRSELTLEEADKLEKVRAAKAKAGAKPKTTKAAKPKRTSALDAAAIVLKDVGRPLNCRELIEMMAARELWQSPNGKTPEATLYSAILRTIAAKGDAAPFKKVGRGLFAFNG